MFYVYIIRSQEGRYYIGSTENVEKRIDQHNSPANRGWTNRFHNWRLVYSESYETRLEARQRELEIKKMKGNSSFKKLVSS